VQLWLYETLGLEPPAFCHVPMLLAPDGRRLSKRDRDLDLGQLRLRMTPEALIGKLAFAAGLLETDAPISAGELAAVFSWDKLRGEAIYLQDL
jgi:glutamyl-tRNA synthetase